MTQKWYSIRIPVTAAALAATAAAPSHAEIMIYGDIGESWWAETVTAKQFVTDLAALDVDTITVRINSYGGSVTDGVAIHNAIKRHRATVTTSIDSAAYSIASLIAMAGNTVEMADNALLMIHAPWSVAAGNSADLREAADTLDTYAAAMSGSYAAKSGISQEDVLALLTDGADHYYTAQEAKDAGFVDVIVGALPMAAHAGLLAEAKARYQRPQRTGQAAPSAPNTMAQAATKPAAPAAQPLETDMTGTTTQAATQAPATETIKSHAEILAADQSRRSAIRACAGHLSSAPGVQDLLRQCEDDVACTEATAKARVLDLMAKAATPVMGGHIVVGEDEADKIRNAGVQAIMARAGVGGADVRQHLSANPVRGYKLLDFARASLQRAGINTAGMDQMQVVAAAFTQGTSDFPILLENAMHKTLLTAYRNTPDTWSRFCKIGSVSDFRANPRYRVGSLGNLQAKNELGEFKNTSIPDGEKGSVTATTKGNIINLSREAIINDDLGAFIGLAEMLGRAARRTVESDVYALLALNSGAGPTMADSNPLFHSSRNNVGTGAALSMAALDADRVIMAGQTDIGGNDYLDLRPAVLLVPLALGGTARTINDALYDPDTANKLQRPNMVNGLFRDIVDTPRLTGTRRYLFADPMEAPVIEVAFLDGNEEPYLEMEQGFTVDGSRWKARLDFGVGAIDFRGAVTNAGA